MNLGVGEMTEERQAKCTQRMWWKLGMLYDASARDIAECGADPFEAIKFAQAAEACYWQATGEGDFTSLTDLVGGE